VLARLNQIEGVDTSFANGPGSLVGLTLRPGADPAKVVREAERALREEATERGTPPPRGAGAAPLSARAAGAALRAERWNDRKEVARQAAEILAAEEQAPSRLPWLLLALLLLGAAVGLRALRRRTRSPSPSCGGAPPSGAGTPG
jgi:hypothetical protein